MKMSENMSDIQKGEDRKGKEKEGTWGRKRIGYKRRLSLTIYGRF